MIKIRLPQPNAFLLKSTLIVVQVITISINERLQIKENAELKAEKEQYDNKINLL